MRVLVVNAGSSSLKLSVVEGDASTTSGQVLPAPSGRFRATALEAAIRSMHGIDAVGHRVVHGGKRFDTSVRIDRGVLRYLATITDLAPLHMPAALAAIEAVQMLLPGLPEVACFDTAFHSTMPAAASTYAIPTVWRRRYGLRRYGFHGFSHAYAARRAAEMLGRRLSSLRVVTCHLGAGASLAAVSGGRSVDTTMGLTPLEGLVMATRSGTVDPGLVLWLQTKTGATAPHLYETLDRRSGLYALAGTADMKQLLRLVAGGQPRARLAFDVYIHRLRSLIAAMAASMSGTDALVFTGGVGENAGAVRQAVISGLGFIGLAVNAKLNRKAAGDVDISSPRAPARTLVVHAREDIEVARAVRQVLTKPSARQTPKR